MNQIETAGRCLAAILVLVLGLVPLAGRAEKYLSIAEAQRLCFPQAADFEEQLFHLDREQKESIEKGSQVKVQNANCRCRLARQGTNLLGVLFFDQVVGRQPKWRDQFKGKTASARFKLNDDIYNISGATISCRHVTEGVKRVLVTYERVVRPRLAATGRLPSTGVQP